MSGEEWIMFENRKRKRRRLSGAGYILNEEPLDTLSSIVYKAKAYDWGKRLCN